MRTFGGSSTRPRLKKIKKTEAFRKAIPSVSISKLLSSSMGSGVLINSNASNASESVNTDEKLHKSLNI